jgi:hypothetical protein
VQESGEKGTGAVDLQPTIPKSEGCKDLIHWSEIGSGGSKLVILSPHCHNRHD